MEVNLRTIESGILDRFSGCSLLLVTGGPTPGGHTHPEGLWLRLVASLHSKVSSLSASLPMLGLCGGPWLRLGEDTSPTP